MSLWRLVLESLFTFVNHTPSGSGDPRRAVDRLYQVAHVTFKCHKVDPVGCWGSSKNTVVQIREPLCELKSGDSAAFSSADVDVD